MVPTWLLDEDPTRAAAMTSWWFGGNGGWLLLKERRWLPELLGRLEGMFSRSSMLVSRGFGRVILTLPTLS